MDLIGSINYIENRLGGRKPNQGRGKPAQKKAPNHVEDEQIIQTDSEHPATEQGVRLGRVIDTTA